VVKYYGYARSEPIEQFSEIVRKQMTNWNSFEQDSQGTANRQDAAYQSGVFDDYAMPSRQYDRTNYDRSYDGRSNLAMSVSLGPVDFLLNNGGAGSSSSYHHHREQWSRQPYLTPDYNYRRGYEDFGESSYMLNQGRPQMRFSDTFRRDFDDQRNFRRPYEQDDYRQRRPLQFDLGGQDFGRDYRRERYTPPYVREDYRSYDNEQPPVRVETRRAPEQEYVERDYVEQQRQTDRSREVQTDDRPSRTLPTNAMSEYDWAVYTKLCDTAKGLIGKHTTEFDNRLPSDRLGCVKAVSLLVDKGLGYNTNDVNTRTFEKDLRNKGFSEVAVSDIKPGDVILGYRAGGDYSHSALYMGNGKIFNNDSDLGTMAIQSIDKFNSTEYKRFVILRHPPEVPAVAPGTVAPHKQVSEDLSVDRQVTADQSSQGNVRPVRIETVEKGPGQNDDRQTDFDSGQNIQNQPIENQQRRPVSQDTRTGLNGDSLNVPDPEDDFDNSVSQPRGKA